jgi:ATP-binding cassette subfamily B protein
MLALPWRCASSSIMGSPPRNAGTINRFHRIPGRGGGFRRVCRAALLSGDLGGRAGGRGFAHAVYRRVVRMDPQFYETTRVGEVLSRLTTDTTLVQAISGVNLSIVLRSILSLVGALVLLGLTSAKLMGVILVLIPVVVVPLILIGRRVRGLSRASQDRIADTSGLAGETLNAIQTVQAFTLEELQSERYRKAVESSFVDRGAPHAVRAALTAVGIMLVFGGITFVLWLGARQVLAAP